MGEGARPKDVGCLRKVHFAARSGNALLKNGLPKMITKIEANLAGKANQEAIPVRSQCTHRHLVRQVGPGIEQIFGEECQRIGMLGSTQPQIDELIGFP